MYPVLWHFGAVKLVDPVRPSINLKVLINGVWYDICVVCHATTDVASETHINHRIHYVEGVGQFCPGCYPHSK